LLVYDLHGKQTQLLEVGRLNNVDVRQHIRWRPQGRPGRGHAARRQQHDVVYHQCRGVVAEAGRFPTG
jgi:3-phytase